MHTRPCWHNGSGSSRPIYQKRRYFMWNLRGLERGRHWKSPCKIQHWSALCSFFCCNPPRGLRIARDMLISEHFLRSYFHHSSGLVFITMLRFLCCWPIRVGWILVSKVLLAVIFTRVCLSRFQLAWRRYFNKIRVMRHTTALSSLCSLLCTDWSCQSLHSWPDGILWR